MNILSVTEDDFDVYGDWLIGVAEGRFIAGCNGVVYTHVQCGEDILKAEIVTHPDFPDWQGVSVGERVRAP